MKVPKFEPGWILLDVASLAVNSLEEEEFAKANHDELYAALLLQLHARVEEVIPEEHQRHVVTSALRAEMRLAKLPQLSGSIVHHLLGRFDRETADQILVELGGEWRIVETQSEGDCKVQFCSYQHEGVVPVIMHNLMADAIEAMDATNNPAEQEAINAQAWEELLASRFGPAVARQREQMTREFVQRTLGSIFGGFGSTFDRVDAPVEGESMMDALRRQGLDVFEFGGLHADVLEQMFNQRQPSQSFASETCTCGDTEHGEKCPVCRAREAAPSAQPEPIENWGEPVEGCTCNNSGICEACRPRLRELATRCGCGNCQVCRLFNKLVTEDIMSDGPGCTLL